MYYHFETEGPNAETFANGLGHAIRLAIDAGNDVVGLAVPTKAVLDGVIQQVLGTNTIKALEKKPHRVTLSSGDHEITLVLITKLIRVRDFHGPILAAFTAMDQIGTLDQRNGCTDVVFVPHNHQDAANFAGQYDSEELPVL